MGSVGTGDTDNLLHSSSRRWRAAPTARSLRGSWVANCGLGCALCPGLQVGGLAWTAHAGLPQALREERHAALLAVGGGHRQALKQMLMNLLVS